MQAISSVPLHELVHRRGEIEISSIFKPVTGLILFSLALWVLHGELASYPLQDILQHRNLPCPYLRALSLTILSYLIMTGYDTLALKYIKHPLPYRKTAFASFIGYAFGNNIGLSMLAGGSVRFRLYSSGASRLRNHQGGPVLHGNPLAWFSLPCGNRLSS